MKMSFIQKTIRVDKSKLPTSQIVTEYHMPKTMLHVNTNTYDMISLANSGKNCFPCDR
jgi:hypothetical protein